MKALLRLLLAAVLGASALGAHAQRAYAPGELESLLAPIALYPDPLVAQILDASRYPQDVAAAAAWLRANPQLSGDAALATVQGTSWAPSVKALAATPEVLERMAESPQWLQDLGEAYTYDAASVTATVQDLRARAQASGYLRSDGQSYVMAQGEAIIVQPVAPNVVYAPWYDPYVVYGGWIWPHRPAYWRPWAARPHFVTRIVIAPPVRWHVHRRAPDFHREPPRLVHREPPRMVHREPPRIIHGGPTVRPYRAIPESRRPPFVHSNALPAPRLSPGYKASAATPPSFRRDGGGRPGGWHGSPQGHRR